MCTIDDDPFDYQVLNLTTKFYNDYPDPPYEEIVRKEARPYNCLLIQSHYDYFICIPYRSHVNHKYGYKFKYSTRSRRTKSGLDYTKIVIIKNPEYIGISDAVVDADEYRETRDNIEFIKKDSQTYIDDYIKHMLGKSNKYDDREFQRAYGFSTLKYFHNELEITVRESFGNLGCSKSITQETEALNAERSKILSNYYEEFYNYKIRKKKH